MTHRRPLRSALFGAVVSLSSLGAQNKPVELRAVLDLRIDTGQVRIANGDMIALSPAGKALLVQSRDHAIRTIDNTGRVSQPEHIDGFRVFGFAGFVSDTLWVADPTTQKIAILGGAGANVRVIPYPPALVGPTGIRHQGPELRGMIPLAVMGNGDIVIIALLSGPDNAADLYAGVPDGTPVLRVAQDGRVRKLLATIPAPMCSQHVQIGDRNISLQVPFCSAPQWTMRPDGSQFSVITAIDPTGAHPRIRGVVVSTKGDTLLDITIPYLPTSIPKRAVDSVFADLVKDQTPQFAAAVRALDLPAAYPMCDRILIARDGSLWVERWRVGDTHDWVIFDGKGRLVGSVRLPGTFRLSAADSQVAWGISRADDGTQAVTRYRIERP